MKKKLIKVALIGKTNVGKSTLINSFVGEKISIINKKINTTQDLIEGIVNIEKTQIIFYDTPGSNFLKTNNNLLKNLKKNIWSALDHVSLILYIIDSSKINFKQITSEIIKISEVEKDIILVFNKVDLIDKKLLLPIINRFEKIKLITSYFEISAKYNKGVSNLSNFITTKALFNSWEYNDNEISNKDLIYSTNECTRNAILEFLHKEIPYNVVVKNTIFKYLNNKDLKIKQSIELKNERYKAIILGKKGTLIKKIRMKSQKDIAKIINSKIHLYVQVNIINEK